jgi:hypothetical protein
MEIKNLEKIVETLKLEKIIGTPSMNTRLADCDLTGSLKGVVIYLKLPDEKIIEEKMDSLGFNINKNNTKLISKMYSPCQLNQKIEVYGTYDPKNKIVEINNLKVIYN